MLRVFILKVSLFTEIKRLQEISINSMTFFSCSQEIEIVYRGIRWGLESRDENAMNFNVANVENLWCTMF